MSATRVPNLTTRVVAGTVQPCGARGQSCSSRSQSRRVSPRGARRRRHRRRQLVRRRQPVRLPLSRSLRPHARSAAQIKRELEGLSPTQASIVVLRDLLYAQTRDALSLRAEVGLFQDLMFHVELPIILDEQNTLRLRSVGGRGLPLRARCHAQLRERDELDDDSRRDHRPAGDGHAAVQGRARGAARRQRARRVRHVQLRADLGAGRAEARRHQADLDPRRSSRRSRSATSWPTIARVPNANHAVSEGMHRLFARTAISHRWRWIEPYMSFWYMYPIARGDSLFKDYGPSQSLKNPQQQGGTAFGAELVPFERPRDGHKIFIDVRGRLEGHFAGKGYSEAWELLAASPALACDMAQARVQPGVQHGADDQRVPGAAVHRHHDDRELRVARRRHRARRAGRAARAVSHRRSSTRTTRRTSSPARTSACRRRRRGA